MATVDVQVLSRAFDGEVVAEGDGRTITGRCVPYDVPANVSDGGPTYREVWRHGAFRNVCKSPNRTTLNYGHATNLADLVGHAVELAEQPDGLYATFRALDGDDGDKALALIRAGVATGLSIHAWVTPRGSRYASDGTVERVKAERLPHVALCQEPAYAGAGVTAVRAADEEHPSIEIPESVAAVLAYTSAARARYDAS